MNDPLWPKWINHFVPEPFNSNSIKKKHNANWCKVNWKSIHDYYGGKKNHKKKSCMQLNVLQLYLNGLMNFFHIHLYMSWIIPFETIEIIIQMLHIALINICWNIHNNLMPHIYTWTSQWIFSPFLNFQYLHINWIIHF